MRKKFTKKIMPLLMAGVLVLGGSLSSVSANPFAKNGIGELNLTRKVATATTIISTASAPANGFVGSAKITAVAKNGKKATNTIVSASSKTISKVSYKETEDSKFQKANSVHKEYYMGSELTNFRKSLKTSYDD